MHLKNESPSDWAKVFEINTSSLFFASMAMLPLLEAGNKSPPKSKTGRTGWSGAIINITSISGVVKMAQDVRKQIREKSFLVQRFFNLTTADSAMLFFLFCSKMQFHSALCLQRFERSKYAGRKELSRSRHFYSLSILFSLISYSPLLDRLPII